MDQNPLNDIVDKAKQQKIDSNLEEIKANIKVLMDKEPMILMSDSGSYPLIKPKLIEVTNWADHKVSVNPAYIVKVETTAKGSQLCFADGNVLDIKESRQDVMSMINESPASVSTYIK